MGWAFCYLLNICSIVSNLLHLMVRSGCWGRSPILLHLDRRPFLLELWGNTLRSFRLVSCSFCYWLSTILVVLHRQVLGRFVLLVWQNRCIFLWKTHRYLPNVHLRIPICWWIFFLFLIRLVIFYLALCKALRIHLFHLGFSFVSLFVPFCFVHYDECDEYYDRKYEYWFCWIDNWC